MNSFITKIREWPRTRRQDYVDLLLNAILTAGLLASVKSESAIALDISMYLYLVSHVFVAVCWPNESEVKTDQRETGCLVGFCLYVFGFVNLSIIVLTALGAWWRMVFLAFYIGVRIFHLRRDA